MAMRMNRRAVIAGAAGLAMTVAAQVKPAAAATDLRGFIEGLRKKTTPNGVMSAKGLKLAGEDPLPKGATLTDTNVILTGGVTLDGWDLGGRGIHVKGRASIANVLSTGVRGAKQGGPLYPVQIGVEGDLEWAEFMEIHGTYGEVGGPSKALAGQERGAGNGLRTGRMRMLRRSRFEGFPQDHTYTYGVPGGEEVIEECYFGPQWAVNGTAPHADVGTIGGAAGHVIWRRNLIDHTAAGNAIGINNIWRIVRNKKDRYNTGSVPVEWLTFEENVAHYDPGKSFPIHIESGGQPGWDNPRIEFIGNWLGANSRGAYFFPGSRAKVTRWEGNRDVDSGRAI